MGRKLSLVSVPPGRPIATKLLRNVALTAPFMHDGAFTSLRQVVEHYNDPARSLVTYRAPDAPAATGRDDGRGGSRGIYVHVAGAVRRPGLMRLPPGSRVAQEVATPCVSPMLPRLPNRTSRDQ